MLTSLATGWIATLPIWEVGGAMKAVVGVSLRFEPVVWDELSSGFLEAVSLICTSARRPSIASSVTPSSLQVESDGNKFSVAIVCLAVSGGMEEHKRE